MDYEERTRSGPPLWMLAALLVIAAVAWQLAAYHRQQQHKELRDALGELQMALERYAVDTEGSYPNDLPKFLADSKLELPKSPFGHTRMKLLAPSDPWEPGGVVYIPFGPIIESAGSGASSPPIVPTDTDQYVLLAYSPLTHNGSQPRFSTEADRDGKLAKIDWTHVDVVLTAGEDSTAEP